MEKLLAIEQNGRQVFDLNLIPLAYNYFKKPTEEKIIKCRKEEREINSRWKNLSTIQI